MKTTRKKVTLAIDEQDDRGGEKRLKELQRLYLVKAGATPDGREFRLFLDLANKRFRFWVAGRPTRTVEAADILEALLSEGLPG